MNKKPQVPVQETPDPAKDFLMSMGDLSLDEIVGQAEAIAELWNLVRAIRYNDIYTMWKVPVPKGILLDGPPGTGKTASVRAVARELEGEITLMELRYLDIASKWIDMPIEQMREFFKIAEEKSKNGHVIIFIDEVDAMLPSRDSQLHETSMKRVNTFLEWMDGGFDSISNITIVAATNYKDGIDKAAIRPGRFDKVITYVDLTSEAISRGLQVHLGKRELNERQLESIDWSRITPLIKSGQLSGADLPEIINRLINIKVTEHIEKLNVAYDFDKMSKTERLTVLKNEDMMPSPISTDDFIRCLEQYISKPRNKQSKSIGFSMSTQAC